MPITKTVNDVIKGKVSKDEAIKQLFERENLTEF